MKNRFIYILIFFTLLSCKRKEETFDQGYSYSPLAIGNYKIYNVQKVTYISQKDSVESYQIKEIITDTITLGNELKYRLERYKRLTSTDSWPFTPDSVWTASIYPSMLIREESNIRYIKLIFPPANGKSWDGNAQNDFGEDDYVYQDVGKSYVVLNNNYSNTITVMQSPNDSNIVNKDYRMEVYANNIGMICKVKETYVYSQQGTDLGTYKIEEGIKYYERLVSYGKQ